MAWGRKDKKSEAEMNAQDRDQQNEQPAEGFAPESEVEGGGAQGELLQEIERLKLERDEANQKYLRSVADYQNFARRAAASEREAKLQGTQAIVLNVIPVLDNFDLALAQDLSKVTAEQFVSGVKVIRDELLKVLTRHGVSLITPSPGDEFDPNRHQAVLQQDDESVEPGHIVQSLATGYALHDRAIRPASVSVRPTSS